MDEIFKRWIDTGQVFQDDLVPIILEYDSLYNEGKLTPNDCLALLQAMFIPIDVFITELLKRIALKRPGQLVEVYSKNGELLRRYWYEK